MSKQISHNCDLLISDYCSLEGDKNSRLSDIERLTLIGGHGLDRVYKILQKNRYNLSFSEIFSQLQTDNIDKAYNYYFLSSEKDFFRFSSSIITPKIIPVHGISSDGEVIDIEYESNFVSFSKDYNLIQQSLPENKIIRVRLWKHHDPKKPTIVCVHGWTMNDYRTNALSFLPGIYYKLGFNVAMFELPFHGRRLNSEIIDANYSLFPSANLILTNEACFQAVHDLRQLKLILNALGLKKVGSLGISLGSYISLIWSSLDSIYFNIGILPFANLGSIALHNLNNDPQFVNAQLSAEYKQKLLEVLSISAPKEAITKTESQTNMFLYSNNDQIIPSSEISILKDLVERGLFIKIDGSHEVNSNRDIITVCTVNFLNNL